MLDERRLAVQQLGRSIDHPAVRDADGLQSEAYAEDGQAARLGPDHIDTHPGLLGGTRTR